MSSLDSGESLGSGESLDSQESSLLLDEALKRAAACPAPMTASFELSPPRQHSSRSPRSLKTLKNKVAATSYSKRIARGPSAQQAGATSPDPRVMKTSPDGTTSTSAPVAMLLHPTCCSHSSTGPLGGSSLAKNRGSRIQESGGITVHTMNSRELSSAWARGAAGRAMAALPSSRGATRRHAPSP